MRGVRARAWILKATQVVSWALVAGCGGASGSSPAADGGVGQLPQVTADSAVPPTDGAADDAMPTELGDAATSEAGADAIADGCPTTQPAGNAPCTGSLSCTYGQTACCGVTLMGVTTCNCHDGTFECGAPLECNSTCGGPGGGR